jgi:Tfp pilus assembly protein PilX
MMVKVSLSQNMFTQKHPPKNWKKGEVRNVLLQRQRFNIIIKSQVGLGYVAILVLLAILSTMGLTFVYKVGLMSSITLNRRTSMQAHHLAESAANHALWRILNDPEFAPESDKYYMHSLGDGRYGYNVRMPTETTFATTATVGAMGDIVTQQSYVQYIIPSNVFTAYGSSTNSVPRYRRLIGAQWTGPGDIPTGATPSVHWTELEGCPIRKEIVAGVLDSNDDIKLAVWDGTSWGNSHVFSTVNAGTGYKRFDVAYESQSGRALVVGRYDETATVRYNVWDGTAWLHATAQPAFNLAGDAVRLVVMASCPGNDQILIATVNSLSDLQLFLWDGSVFTDLGVIETSTMTEKHGAVEIVYERQSGDALVIWTVWGSTPKFRVWNGTALSTENVVPVFPDNVNFLRAASDPTSDHIVVAGIDKFYDIQVGIWDGTAWTDSREVWNDCANNYEQGIDVAWEATGEDALVVWAPWGSTRVRYLAWKKGTALADSTTKTGPNLQNESWLVHLLPISQSEKIILLGENTSNDLRYSLWDGERFKGDPGILLESNDPVQNDVAFDLTEANVPRSGGLIKPSYSQQWKPVWMELLPMMACPTHRLPLPPPGVWSAVLGRLCLEMLPKRTIRYRFRIQVPMCLG